MFNEEFFNELDEYSKTHPFIGEVLIKNNKYIYIEDLFKLLDSYCKTNHIYDVKEFGYSYNFKHNDNKYEVSKVYGPEEFCYIKRTNEKVKYLDINNVLNNKVESIRDKEISFIMNDIMQSIDSLSMLGVPCDIINNELTTHVKKLSLSRK